MATQFSKSGCNNIHRLSKNSFISSCSNISKNFFIGLNSIKNEKVNLNFSEYFTNTGNVANIPVFEGTLTGYIYANGTNVQTFKTATNGFFILTSIVDTGFNVITGQLVKDEGLITLIWDNLPDSSYLIVSYEFDNPDWSIASFDPNTGTVCVNINTTGETKVVSVTLSVMRNN